MSHRRRCIVALALFATSCGVHYATPTVRAHDARFGYLAGSGAPPSSTALCHGWSDAVRGRDRYANDHVSFPETDPVASCFTPVRYTNTSIEVGTPPPGCAWPHTGDLDRLRALADQVDALAAAPAEPTRLLPCHITATDRAAALRHNARVLRATAERVERDPRPYPYPAVVTFGFGWPDQAETTIADWLPGMQCHPITQSEIDRMGAMVLRTRRIADALRAHIAPMAIVSGGTEHSRMVEAFAMLFLLRCELGVPEDRVLVEPCAEHTHTNMRDSARWMIAMNARTAYIVTDDGLQDDYLEEFSGFELVFGSLDMRSRRDWGYVMGAWRRAAEGPNVGYWFTPYRFWAEPRDGLGSLSCDDDP